MKNNQMSAQCMFEILGYELDTETRFYPEQYKRICYKNGKDVILFTIGKNISFKKYFNNMLNEKDCSDYACSITCEELRAINKQVYELECNKSKAKEMFEKLGYKQEQNDDDAIKYINNNENEYVKFFKKYKEYDYVVNGVLIIPYNKQLLRAISEQIKELGW